MLYEDGASFTSVSSAALTELGIAVWGEDLSNTLTTLAYDSLRGLVENYFNAYLE